MKSCIQSFFFCSFFVTEQKVNKSRFLNSRRFSRNSPFLKIQFWRNLKIFHLVSYIVGNLILLLGFEIQTKQRHVFFFNFNILRFCFCSVQKVLLQVVKGSKTENNCDSVNIRFFVKVKLLASTWSESFTINSMSLTSAIRW